MQNELERCLRFIFSEEGGYSNHAWDNGGETKWGISDMADGKKDGKYKGFTIKTMTIETAKNIYEKDYWKVAKCDVLPKGLNLMVFDTAVNSGCSRAIKLLQKSLGVEADGVFGAKSAGVLLALPKSQYPHLIQKFCDNRLTFLQGLEDWKKAGKGWSARVARVRKQALLDVT